MGWSDRSGKPQARTSKSFARDIGRKSLLLFGVNSVEEALAAQWLNHSFSPAAPGDLLAAAGSFLQQAVFPGLCAVL